MEAKQRQGSALIRHSAALRECQIHASIGCAQDRGLDPKGGLDVLPREHLAFRSGRQYLAFVEEQNVVRKTRRQVEVMHYTDHHQISCFQQLLQLPHEFELIKNVEKSQRFIEKQISALARNREPNLCQYSREMNALFFSSA